MNLGMRWDGTGMDWGATALGGFGSISRRLTGRALLSLLLLACLWPSSTEAAECTTTWIGPSVGTWQTAEYWSGESAPSSGDVACIGVGNTVKVTSGPQEVDVVQGKGSLALASTLALEGTAEPSTIGSLAMEGGILKGSGTLSVSTALTWTASSKMQGSGSTVLLPGATGSINIPFTAVWLEQRDFVNEGTFTITAGQMVVSEGSEVHNIGTFNANGEGTPAIAAGEGGLFVNTGIYQKTFGSGTTTAHIFFENEGDVDAGAGKFAFRGGGSSGPSGNWEAPEGSELLFGEGSYALADGVLSGVVTVVNAGAVTIEDLSGEISHLKLPPGGSLGVQGGPMTIVSLTMEGGILKGSGILNVSSALTWTAESKMQGSGSTVLLPGATGSMNIPFVAARLEQRDFVNEGTFTLTAGQLLFSEGAEIHNTGTFNANGEGTAAIASIEAGPFVNTGIFQKTSGSGTTNISPDFENLGTIKEGTGSLKIENPISRPDNQRSGKRSKCADPVDCATGNFSESQVDIAIGGRGIGLSLVRTYSAQAAATAGAFGYGWTASFSDRLVFEEEGKKITLLGADGSAVQFIKAGEGPFAAPAWSQDALSGSAEAGYTLVRADQTEYEFSGVGRLESITDRNGNETTLSYDESGHLETITDPASRQIVLTYNESGRIKSAEDPMGHVVEYGYEGNDLASVTMPGEAEPRWHFKYDGSHRMTAMTNGRGGKTKNEYDGSNRVISQTDPAEHTITFAYAPFHTTVTNESTGSVTDQWFTSNNSPYSITRGAGTADATTETFAYDSAGRLRSVTDGNGHKMSYGYDADGNRTSEKDAEGNTTKWAYNETHDLISYTTPGGETTTIERDGDGNVESISRPGPEETTQTSSFEYDENGQLESITDPVERTWTYGYNAQGDRSSEADPLGNTATFEYDEGSRLISIVSPRGNAEGAEALEYTTTIERDPQGRPEEVVDPLGHSTKYAYDGNGNLEARTDANGHTTEYAYDPNNRRIKVEKPNGAVLETGYDGAGNVTSQTDANEEATTYVRNALGLPVEVIDPLGRKTIEEFDPAGNLEVLIDPEERETSYSYDLADRLEKVSYSDEATPDVELEYDPDGNVTKMVDGTGESSFEYDELGRLDHSENGHSDVVGYEYDLAEQLAAITYPNGKEVAREFDLAGRLESVTDWLGGTTTFAYDPDSNLESIAFPIGSGNVDEYAYDRASRMSEATFRSGAETIASLSYEREKVGQIEEEAVNGLPGPEEVVYGYDENDRLESAGAAGYEYDPADNLTKAPGSTNKYDDASQLETGTGVAYSYDKLGARIKATPSEGPATSYEYDQAHNLISIQRPEEGEVPAIEESLAYDGSGLLVSKTSGLATSYLSWDLSASLPLLLEDNQNSYIYGPGDLPISQISAEAPTYLHHDQLGSTRLLTDAAGETTATFTYEPYGAMAGQTGTATTPLGFAGQYTDSESGLQYLRARFYDPETAQFLSKDPVFELTRAAYSYASNSPLTFTDPSGQACVETSNPFGMGPSVTYPNIGDCFADSAEEVIRSPVTGPVVTYGFCALAPEVCTPIRAFLAAGSLAFLSNFFRAEDEKCFNLLEAQVEGLLLSMVGQVPGGILRYFGGPAGQIAPRGVRMTLDAPGLLLDLLRALRGV